MNYQRLFHDKTKRYQPNRRGPPRKGRSNETRLVRNFVSSVLMEHIHEGAAAV